MENFFCTFYDNNLCKLNWEKNNNNNINNNKSSRRNFEILNECTNNCVGAREKLFFFSKCQLCMSFSFAVLLGEKIFYSIDNFSWEDKKNTETEPIHLKNQDLDPYTFFLQQHKF